MKSDILGKTFPGRITCKPNTSKPTRIKVVILISLMYTYCKRNIALCTLNKGISLHTKHTLDYCRKHDARRKTRKKKATAADKLKTRKYDFLSPCLPIWRDSHLSSSLSPSSSSSLSRSSSYFCEEKHSFSLFERQAK